MKRFVGLLIFLVSPFASALESATLSPQAPAPTTPLVQQQQNPAPPPTPVGEGAGNGVATPLRVIPAPLPGASATFKELDLLRSENAILAERVKALELRQKLQAGAAPIPITTGAGSVSGGSASAGGQIPVSAFMPVARVTMVAGAKGRFVATIQMPDGSVVAVKAGSTVSGLGQVESVSTSEVLVKNGKRTTSVPFAAESTANTLIGGQVAR